jgi:hypothetical protein
LTELQPLTTSFLYFTAIVVVATKVDKLSKQERERSLVEIQEGLGLPEGQPLCVSSVTGEGCRALWRILLEACETRVEEFKSKYEEGSGEQPDESPQFEDSDDFAYNQGYDWIHGDNNAVAEGDDEEGYDDDENQNEDDFPDQEVTPQRETLKSLKKKVRDLERRGEI